MRCIRLSRSISAASTTVTAYWVHYELKWALNHAAKCIHLQLVEPIRVIHLVTEQRTGECNVFDIHPCNRLVHIKKTLDYNAIMYPFERQDWNDKRQNTIINSTR